MVSDPPDRPPIRLPLNQLRRGDRAVMAGSSLSEEDRALLQAMGLDEQSAFTVCRAGRAGPCIIQLDATRLGLSPELAARILTRPCDCPDAGSCRAPEGDRPPEQPSAK
jgi:Fe2+ transport system protein FeoA